MQVFDDDDLHGGQRSSEVKCDKLCVMATQLGQKKPWCKFMMMMTFMKVKGHQKSNVVNFALWLPNLVRRNPGASLWWWWPSWRSKSSEVKCGELCTMVTKLGQKMMMTFIEVKGQNEVKYSKLCSMATNVVRLLMIIMTYIKVKGQQRWNLVIHVMWLPHLIRCTATS